MKLAMRRTVLAFTILAATAVSAAAQASSSPPAGPAPSVQPLAPFEVRLMRLSEILGSLHYLRNLCGETGSQWREEMEGLITAENPDPAMRARLVASFNSGYRSFSGVYVACTESAHAAISRYMREGEELAREIAVRFGN